MAPLQLETQQREDMKKAIDRVRRIDSGLTVEAFFARKTWDGKVAFERVVL